MEVAVSSETVNANENFQAIFSSNSPVTAVTGHKMAATVQQCNRV
jgi:hypothetical protein